MAAAAAIGYKLVPPNASPMAQALLALVMICRISRNARGGALGALFLAAAAFPCRAGERIPIKVIVVAGFEVGADTGDVPGEFQFWAEREGLTQKAIILKRAHPLCHNDKGLYGIVGGNSTDKDLSPNGEIELITALCLDPRFDLRKTYWIVDGIAGIDPAAGPMGSAVWAENVVDGDALREIDDRQLPTGWPYGLFAIGTKAPDQLPTSEPEKGGGWGGATLAYSMNHPLNGGLARWAYAVSKDVKLMDSTKMEAWRKRYTGFPSAQGAPKVMMGDALGSIRYWHGASRTQWARDWVRMWTGNKGTFATTSMEAQTFTGSLMHMADEGHIDFSRVLVLRTASNYCTPPPGDDVITTIGDESLGTDAALEAAYSVGSVVAHELLDHWDRYENAVPAE
jgi:purine nucleoside permease